jgi:hypothetical protein
MTFPVSPVNGEKANVNGITYTYDSGLSAWTVSTNFIDGVTANLITANSVTASGNVIGGNIVSIAAVSGASVVATGNVSGGNITTGGSIAANGTISTGATISASGNVTGGNISVTGNVTGATISASGNVAGGNIAVTNNISAGGNLTVSGSLIGDGVSFADGTPANTLITTSTGNVGIGTGAPTTKLHVDQGADSNGITLAYSVRGASRVNWQLSGVTNEAMSFIHNNGSNTQTMLTMGRDSLEFLTNNTERMRIDSAGRVTTPSQPAFIAFSDSNQEPVSQTLIAYTGVNLNRGNNYNTATSRFTAPVAGLYQFHIRTWLRPPGGSTVLVLLINGVSAREVRLSIASAGDYNTLTPIFMANLSVNDYVQVSTGGNASHSSTTLYYSEFSGYLVG